MYPYFQIYKGQCPQVFQTTKEKYQILDDYRTSERLGWSNRLNFKKNKGDRNLYRYTFDFCIFRDKNY